MAPQSEEAAEAAYATVLTFGVPQLAAGEVDRAVAALTEFARAKPRAREGTRRALLGCAERPS